MVPGLEHFSNRVFGRRFFLPVVRWVLEQRGREFRFTDLRSGVRGPQGPLHAELSRLRSLNLVRRKRKKGRDQPYQATRDQLWDVLRALLKMKGFL